MLPASVLSKVEQYLKKICRAPAPSSASQAARLSDTACCTGAVRDLSATTNASASGDADASPCRSAAGGTPIT
jgi:hypothetical protein